ncbi:hypothetical protein CWI39_1405p0020 [Hamiltosporidium magnivora]|uniref:Uncharacterized protein n=1 Tax=Hamiltosporidium magnivora TaxID=148818 RepID=A0A4Q9L2M2_9MICR|nr:hypothetical protein CWI39_1405p0020 [Hamiltosporidium magnivora]
MNNETFKSDFSISKNTDYITTRSTEDMVSDILPIFENITILSVYKQRCLDLFKILNKTRKCKLFDTPVISPEISIFTPRLFLENIEEAGQSKLLVLDDCHLFIDFGYLDIMKEIKNRGYNFIGCTKLITDMEFMKNPIILTNGFSYFIKCHKNEAFQALFVIFNFKMLKGSVCLVVDPKLIRKFYIFLQVFGVDCCYYKKGNQAVSICSEEEVDSDFKVNNLIIVGKKSVDCQFENIIYLSNQEIEGIRPYNLDYTKIEKYNYRINDVLRSITPSVIKGVKDFDYERFKNIKSVIDYKSLS